jgi:hypothetical protein
LPSGPATIEAGALLKPLENPVIAVACASDGPANATPTGISTDSTAPRHN